MDAPYGLGEVLVKSDDDVPLDCGCAPAERSLEEYVRKGVVVVDKPAGPTSHQVSSWVKGIFGVEKAGHSGTLDPKVTGVLPVFLESATRLADALLSSSKEYVGVMRVHEDTSDEKINSVFSEFSGAIYQKPPLKSAVKRSLRTRQIYSLKLLESSGRDSLFQVSCEAGTYIRKLVHDVGLVLGCGAHMQELRRTKAGSFTEEDALILQDIKDAFVSYKETGREERIRSIIRPMEDAISPMKKIWLKGSAVGAVAHGAKLMAPGIASLHDSIQKGDYVALMSPKDEVVALAEALYSSKELMQVNKGVVAKPARVIMEPDAYPRIWGAHK
jgi:H/ACA ribonucleoprotein complex subunit 4